MSMTAANGRLTAGGSILVRWEVLGRPLPHLPRWAASALVALTIAVMAWSVSSTREIERLEHARNGPTTNADGSSIDQRGDLALYERISARVAAGEGYYAAATGEQREAGYPTRPFVTVRLPTLAYLHLLITPAGVRYLQMALVLCCLLALSGAISRMTTMPERVGASVMLVLGGTSIAAPLAGLYHEALAGVLLALAMLLYRPERWWPALLAAGCAIAVRELAVPFVVLWLAFALAGSRWREAAGVGALLAVFAGGMTLHAFAVAAAQLPTDIASDGWNAMNGYALPLMVVARLSVLSLLPTALAAPLAILPLLGWLSLGGRLGLFAVLWFGGLFTMTALFARPENFYWMQLALPAYAVGLAFSPRALIQLARGVGSVANA
jgi:hypothetical protein